MTSTVPPMMGSAGAAKKAATQNVFIAAFLVALYRVSVDVPETGPGWEVFAVAQNIAQGRGFVDPFAAGETGPTAHVAPLYPAFLALLMRAGGEAFYGFLMAVAGTVLFALHACLLIPVSEALLGARKPGIYAALLSVFTVRIVVIREAIPAAVALMLYTLFAARVLRSSRSVLWKGAAAGLGCGFVLLLNPSAILICPPICVFLVSRNHLGWPALMRMSGAFLGAAALVCLPWVARTHAQLGGFVSIRSNLGLELAVSNNGCAAPTLSQNLVNGCHAETHPNASEAVVAIFRQKGEIAYNRERFSEAITWMAANPKRLVSLTASRFRYHWFPEAEAAAAPYAYAVWFATALSIAGLISLLRADSNAAWLLLAAPAVYSMLYYFIQADIMYRYPVLWMSLLPAGYILCYWLEDPMRRILSNQRAAR